MIDNKKNYNLHIDGSFQHLYNLAAGGGCILDNDKMIKSFAELLPSHIPSNYHEYFALAYSLEQTLSLGISNISVQTDCLRLNEDIKTLLQLKNNDDIQNILKELDLFNKIKKFNSFSLEYKPREQNMLADYVVNKFCDSYIEEHNLKKEKDISPKKIYINNNKFFQSNNATVSKDFLKNIQNQIVGVLKFNNVDSVKVKLLHYSKNDLNCLEKEYNVILPSKGFGKKIVTELGNFLSKIEEKNIRISFTGDLHEKIINYVRPHSELLDETSKNNIHNIYEKFEVINFTPLTEFAFQVRNSYIEELHQFNVKDDNSISPVKKVSPKHKNFFFLAMRTLGKDIEDINQFLNEHNDNPFIQEISNLSIELKQKFFFEKFLNLNDLNNISSYLKQKENFRTNGINFKF